MRSLSLAVAASRAASCAASTAASLPSAWTAWATSMASVATSTAPSRASVDLGGGTGGVRDAEGEAVAPTGARGRGHGGAQAHREDRDDTTLGEPGGARATGRGRARRRARGSVPAARWPTSSRKLVTHA